MIRSRYPPNVVTDRSLNQETKESLITSLTPEKSLLTVLRAEKASAFAAMDKDRCSQPDITFDEDGNLDESSQQLILAALEDPGKWRGTI